MKNSTTDLIDFLDESVSPYHAVVTAQKALKTAGASELFEDDASWNIEWDQSYYISRADTSIIAFRTPENPQKDTMALVGVGTHTDSPCFKLKTNALNSISKPTSLNLEVYGGALLNSWLDRDLGLAGMVWGKDSSGKSLKKIIQTGSWFRIPQLAIHLDREISATGLKLNPQTQMAGLLGMDIGVSEFYEQLKSLSGLDEILSFDLVSYDTQEAKVGGLRQEFLYSGRLDNLAMLHASLSAFNLSNSSSKLQLLVSFNHEEVGSLSFEGAKSNFLPQVLKRVYDSLDLSLEASGTQSFFISADMAHAWHPGFEDRFDPDNHPLINKGPVIKLHANARYGTSGASMAFLKDLLNSEDIAHQIFHARNDLSCGSTIGPSCASQLGIPVIDIGNPMFSMHSAREMLGTLDIAPMQKLFNAFYQSPSLKGEL